MLTVNAAMGPRSLSVTWQGQAFRFDLLQPMPSSSKVSLWAVTREREFIGTMECNSDVTTEDFEALSLQWLRELLAAAGSTR